MVPLAGSKMGKASAIFCVALLSIWQIGYGQVQAGPPGSEPPPQQQQQTPLLAPQQLDNLVAPVALYPDPLLGQVLAASTYPLEVVEAARWLQQNGNLQGQQRMEAAKQQNWDPSVAALVAFPDVLNLLNNDIRWTTDLGNAFLSQQADVMAAVQRMRARAEANGKLRSTPQESVTTAYQNGQTAIQIQPADPQVIYVPVYQPEYIWGPPVWGAYPALWYPPGFAFGFGFGWAPGIYIGGFFPGLLGWGGWGWGLGWFGGGLFVNAGFFSHFGFPFFGGFGRGYAGLGAGRALWAHDPGHRMGVAYGNRAVAARYGSSRYAGAARSSAFSGMRAGAANAFGGRQFGTGSRSTGGFANSYARGGANYGAYGSRSSGSYGGFNSAQSYRGSSSYGRSYGNSYSAPRSENFSSRSYSAPRSENFSSRSYSAPRSSSSSRSYSAPRGSLAPHSSGGGHSGGGGHFGGGHSGGGHHR
jgi:Protein of unknown function (DUF3300)